MGERFLCPTTEILSLHLEASCLAQKWARFSVYHLLFKILVQLGAEENQEANQSAWSILTSRADILRLKHLPDRRGMDRASLR